MKKHPDYTNLFVADHPLILHKLSMMRDTARSAAHFKMLLREIGLLMGYEVTRGLPMATRHIDTPLTSMEAPVLAGEEPVIVPVLRAGLVMAGALEELMPAARVGHIGVYRDAKTLRPVEYLVKLPPVEDGVYIVVDPMLATGYSAKHAIDVLVRQGADPSKIRLMVLVAAPEGVGVVLDAWPQVAIYTAALDDHLNDKAYIVPGLGDAGDRLFGTGH